MTAPARRWPAIDLIALACAALLPMPWLLLRSFASAELPPELVASLSGIAILGGAFLLSWATELAERDMPQALAILILALVSVLPEYAVDLHFAWRAGKDPSYAPYAIANMTGANRLLIGLGWAAVVLVACGRSGTSELALHPRQRMEIRYLVWATLYSFAIPLSGTVNLFDAAVLLCIFAAYVYSAMRSDSHEVELAGPAALIDAAFGNTGRRVCTAALFAFAAFAIFASAEPFAEGLVEIGRHRAIDEFLLVQWVAPLASESPEFAIAIMFAWKLRGSLGIGALISSKVNQWTLLVGAIPIAFALSSSSWRGLPLDERQTEELLLTSAQSLLAALVIADLRFSRVEATMLALLFMGQFAFPSTEVRYAFIALYLALFAALFIARGSAGRAAFVSLVLSAPASDRQSAERSSP